MTQAAVNTHGVTMPNGKHKGELITRVPVSYLKWMVNEATHALREHAKAELERRGTVTPEIEISGHAIDSASLRVRKIWHQTRGANEGLHAWLCRFALKALNDGKRIDDKIHYAGIKWVIHDGAEFPVLKTVMRSGKE